VNGLARLNTDCRIGAAAAGFVGETQPRSTEAEYVRAGRLRAYLWDMDSSLEERLLKLETNVTHLEHLCEQLNQVVTEQSKTITRLKLVQQQLSNTVESQELERIKGTNAKPPHYSV